MAIGARAVTALKSSQTKARFKVPRTLRQSATAMTRDLRVKGRGDLASAVGHAGQFKRSA